MRGLRTAFELDEGTVRAVDGVDLDLPRGGSLGVVGESGCGKSVMARSIMQILDVGGRITGGNIVFNSRAGEVDIASLDPESPGIRNIRGAEISMIFQEPMTAFSPVYTIGRQVDEVLLCHGLNNRREARKRTLDMLARTGIPDAPRAADSYPFELSGGMRQRAMIAMSLVGRPALVIADEPTTALDVTIQAQILRLLRNLRRELGMAVLVISHNMGVIAELADTVAVMYLGRIVERAGVDELFNSPGHPYTQALLKAIPRLGRSRAERLETITGSVPDAYHTPAGCVFHPRCPMFRKGVCDVAEPPDITVGPSHAVRCVLYGKQP